ncbi:MAG: serine/threonine-protein kinase [Myxococcota bacterium]
MGVRSRPREARGASFASTERLGAAVTQPSSAEVHAQEPSRPQSRRTRKRRSERRQRSAESLQSASEPLAALRALGVVDSSTAGELARAGALIAGKYRLEQPLARGAMGTIWRAEQVYLGCPVALKLIDERAPRSAQAKLRFLREARTAAALRGPHVVQLLDYGIDQGTPYLVMELLAGESLRERLARVGCLSRRETVRIVTQLARALERAEKLHIVHRDLSPNNVFLVEEDGKPCVKLLDFGIAKCIRESEPRDVGLTLNGMILGTPSYMSPEQLEGSAGIDCRSDIWALGVIAFECLLGFVPFQSESFAGLVLAICSRPLPSPSSFGALPAAFDAWFQRACAREQHRRFSSAREAAHELRRALSSSKRT